MSQDAPDRSKRVLAALVREFIASGEPVASSLLVTAAGLGVSSATVGSILARLEEEGYVQQPHTSAGRIPTDRGYRFYVDQLLEARRPGDRAATAVEARPQPDRPDRPLDPPLPPVAHARPRGRPRVARFPGLLREAWALRSVQGAKRPCSIAWSSFRSARRACSYRN